MVTNILSLLFTDTFHAEIAWIVFGFALLIIAMIVDLITGVRKAIKNGEATTSQGFKKTCDKARKYFTPALCMVCIDLLASCIFTKPYFTLMYLAFCIFCETKSVLEKSYEKAEMRKMEKTMNVVIENNNDIKKLLKELARELAEEEKKKQKDK